jgi:CRISPR/Cas system CSM-associated protein Csm3 (group 7 of RAMP superfamily)
MKNLEVRVSLKSEAIFASGTGVPGLVDIDVVREQNTGLPFIPARTLRGLLVESASDLLFALRAGRHPMYTKMADMSSSLFGSAGTTTEQSGSLRIGDGRLPRELRVAVSAEVGRHRYVPEDILEMLTTIRHRTAEDSETRTAKKGSLRSERVLLEGLEFTAPISIPDGDDALQLLVGCAAGIRRAGLSRNRGHGKVRVTVSTAGAGGEREDEFRLHLNRLCKRLRDVEVRS